MLAGVRVLDCTNQLGWVAGRVLADLGADVLKVESSDVGLKEVAWQAHNLNKRCLILDIRSQSDALDRLVAGTDILLETATPGTAEFELFDHSILCDRNDRLIHVAITPFGRTGPRAEWLASDLELMAASGAMSLAGKAGAMPVRVSAPQSGGWAGVSAAVGALIALHARQFTGRGQLVDISAQAAIIAGLAHAPTFWDLERTVPMRAGEFITGRSVKGARFRAFWPCRDGYINFILYGGVAGQRTNQALVEWMRETGVVLGVLEEVDWTTFSPTLLTQSQVDAIEDPVGRFLGGLTKREFLNEASQREMLGYPVSNVADIANDPQLAARNFWTDVASADGKSQRFCGSFAIVDGERKPTRYTPTDVSATPDEIRAWLDIKPPEPVRQAPESEAGMPLSDVKVCVFGGYAAGPWIGKLLANFGALVVHVETRDRPDGFRLEYPPFKNGRKDVNHGAAFAFFNDSKFGITLDVKKPGGLDLAKRLTDWCDIVIENMRPGVMARLGLGYDALTQTNPDLIQLSTCNMGQTGPRAHMPGFGSQLSAMAGFCGLVGERDGPPMLLYGPYIDFIAALYGASAILAALARRRTSKRGAHIDLSQYECGLQFLASELLEFHTNGEVAHRRGNFDPSASPHGAYLCADGEWLALSVWSKDEFMRLAGLIGHSEWTQDKQFQSLAGRCEKANVIDAAITEWCGSLAAGAAATALQSSSIHAYAVNTVADLFCDPQLAHRGTWRLRPHPFIGDQAYYFPGFDLSDTPGDVTRAGPVLGGDNEKVYREWLGLSKAEFERYRDSGVIC